MNRLLSHLRARYAEHFGGTPEFVMQAPGRVNLMGDHTDYNAGLVLPCAINRHVIAGLSPRTDNEVHVLAIDSNSATDKFSLNAPISPHPTQLWRNYIRGAVRILLEQGCTLRGCNIAVTGDIPKGAGLSSSAALVVSVLSALNESSTIGLETIELATLAQAVENEFVGCACGIMDQLASVAGLPGSALMIDCSSLTITPTKIPPSLSLLVINSNVQRKLVDSYYNRRREQCESAANFLGKTNLRALELTELLDAQSRMDPVLVARARHVIEENQRVRDLAAAFAVEDHHAVSRIMDASHSSLRDLFEVSVPQVDFLVEIVRGVLGVRGGVRMTGGGFGGSVVALLPEGLTDEVEFAVRQKYHSATGLEADIYHARPSGGLALAE